MGGVADSIKAGMAENMTNQQVAMRAMQVEMQMKMRQAGMSMQLAIARERFWYYSLFVGTLFTVLPLAAIKTHNPRLLGPLFPMGISWTFQYDMYYGNLQIRARKEAERMIREEPERFFLPSNSGILDQNAYNKLMDVPADYKPKINP